MKTWGLVFLILLNSACKDDQLVYVCLSRNAHRFHLRSDCPGLNRCTYRISQVTVKKAKAAGRTLCHLEGGHDELTK